VLDFTKLVQAERRCFGLGGIGKSVLSACLALLLIAAATLSACHVLHQFLHQSPDTGEHLCLVCSLTGGQLITPEGASFVLLAIFAFAFLLRAHEIFIPTPVQSRLSHSRAPPDR